MFNLNPYVIVSLSTFTTSPSFIESSYPLFISLLNKTAKDVTIFCLIFKEILNILVNEIDLSFIGDTAMIKVTLNFLSSLSRRTVKFFSTSLISHNISVIKLLNEFTVIPDVSKISKLTLTLASASCAYTVDTVASLLFIRPYLLNAWQ